MTKISHVLRATAALAVGAAILAAGGPARAESSFDSGGGPLNAAANLDFRVVIPRILFLQVGTGTQSADNATINLIDFTVTAADVGSGTPVAGTGGDLTGGVVTARLRANAGNVTLSSVTTGPLQNADGDTLSFSQIATATAALTSATPLAAPALVDGATTSTTVSAVNRVVNRDARWTFSYLNAATVAAGTYGGVNTQNGRVTYTASLP